MPQLPEIRRFVSAGGAKIYRIPCKVFAELTARVYLVLEAGPPTLVDAGSGRCESPQNILDGFETVRREFGESIRVEDIRRIVITHAHLDHCGGLSDLIRRTEAEICIHPLDSRLITANAEWIALASHNVEQLLTRSGVPQHVAAQFLIHHGQPTELMPGKSIHVTLLDGERLDGLRVVHTPGHSSGHVCLMIDDLLLCGDHILSKTIPQLWPESIRPSKGLGHYLESLRVVRALPDIRIALPGHEAIIENLAERIDQIERSQQRRIDYAADVVSQAVGPMTLWEISKTIYPQTTGFFASLAFMDTAARIEYLHDRGRLRLANLDQIKTQQPDAAWQYCPA